MTKIIEKKLTGCLGKAYTNENKIEIDPRQKPFEYLDTMIHEKLHIIKPEFSESVVSDIASELSKFLWENNYRQVKQ